MVYSMDTVMNCQIECDVREDLKPSPNVTHFLILPLTDLCDKESLCELQSRYGIFHGDSDELSS
jgi:hypothetical protein